MAQQAAARVAGGLAAEPFRGANPAPESDHSRRSERKARSGHASSRSPRISVWRLFLITGSIVSWFLLIVEFLDQSARGAAISGILAVGFLLALLRRPAP
jgi:hypothetical protein